MLKKALIEFDSGYRDRGTVVGVMEVSERGFGGIHAAENQTLWDCTNLAVSPGDRWQDGIFTRPDGSEAEYIQTMEDKQADLEARQAASEDAIMGLMAMSAPAN